MSTNTDDLKPLNRELDDSAIGSLPLPVLAIEDACECPISQANSWAWLGCGTTGDEIKEILSELTQVKDTAAPALCQIKRRAALPKPQRAPSPAPSPRPKNSRCRQRQLAATTAAPRAGRHVPTITPSYTSILRERSLGRETSLRLSPSRRVVKPHSILTLPAMACAEVRVIPQTRPRIPPSPTVTMPAHYSTSPALLSTANVARFYRPIPGAERQDDAVVAHLRAALGLRDDKKDQDGGSTAGGKSTILTTLRAEIQRSKCASWQQGGAHLQ